MTEDDEFMKGVAVIVETGGYLKKAMIAKGLRRARAKCPRCGNETLQGLLAGKKNHLRMWCETPGCTIQMME